MNPPTHQIINAALAFVDGPTDMSQAICFEETLHHRHIGGCGLGPLIPLGKILNLKMSFSLIQVGEECIANHLCHG